MPSPFPGMDPFLESPRWFPSLHDKLITYIEEHLQPRLPAPYYALGAERVWVEISGRRVTPDVSVLETAGRRADPGTQDLADASRGVATAPPARPVVVKVEEDELRETYLDIYEAAEGKDRLVTSIEVLSPANKDSGENNRGQYLEKQRETLDSRVNLVEIDLLRGGLHTTAVPPRAAADQCGRYDYHVCIRRIDLLGSFTVYPILLNAPLPAIQIPLLPGDPDIELDLQAVFTRAYDTGPYRRTIRYLEERPVPPLDPRLGPWVEECLRAAT